MENKKFTPKTFTDHFGNLSRLFKEYCETFELDIAGFENNPTAKESLERVKGFLNGTTEEALFFSVIFDYAIKNKRVSVNCISDFLTCDPYEIINYTYVFDSLKQKRLIVIAKQWDEFTYRIPDKIFQCIISEDNSFILGSRNLDFYGFISEVSAIYDSRDSDDLSDKDCNERIDYLFSLNQELDICKKINDLNLPYVERNVLLHLIISSIADDGSIDLFYYVSKVTRSVSEKGRYKRLFHTSKTILQQKNIVTFVDIGSFHNDRHLALSDYGIEYLIAEYTVKQATEFQPGSFFTHIKCSDIKQKNLFFDLDYEKKMNELNKLLSTDSYHSIVSRLKEKKLAPGFTIMFYGYAGTGKTESALQLAHYTGRDVLMVNIESIRNKFVGESEKRLAEVFKKYKEAVSMFEREPILLFNEADALIGKRINIRDSVDQMNNAMQNILLQQLEDFEGILIATTNLNENLDAAFERRFLFKVKFEKPSENILSQIWKSHLPHISDAECMKLAKQYAFSGGQVTNIIRKTELHYMLNGDFPDYKQIIVYCEEEKFSKIGATNTIGFRKNEY